MTASREAQGVAYTQQEQLKHRKYASLSPSCIFYPVCIQTLGAWGESAKALIHKVGTRGCENAGDPRASSFLVQRLAIDVQRGYHQSRQHSHHPRDGSCHYMLVSPGVHSFL